jgi:hypothetical protein
LLVQLFQQAEVDNGQPHMLEEWWLQERARFQKRQRKSLDSPVILFCCEPVDAEEAVVYGNLTQQCNDDNLASRILEDMKLLV